MRSPTIRTVRRGKPRRAPGPRYTRHSYRVAIQRACRRAGIPLWSPHQPDTPGRRRFASSTGWRRPRPCWATPTPRSRRSTPSETSSWPRGSCWRWDDADPMATREVRPTRRLRLPDPAQEPRRRRGALAGRVAGIDRPGCQGIRRNEGACSRDRAAAQPWGLWIRPYDPAVRHDQPRCEPGLRRELPGPDRPLLQVTAILEEGECVILRCPPDRCPAEVADLQEARSRLAPVDLDQDVQTIAQHPDADASAGAGPLRYLPQVGEIRTGPLQVAVTRTGEAYSKSSTRSPGGPARSSSSKVTVRSEYPTARPIGIPAPSRRTDVVASRQGIAPSGRPAPGGDPGSHCRPKVSQASYPTTPTW